MALSIENAALKRLANDLAQRLAVGTSEAVRRAPDERERERVLGYGEQGA